MLTLVLVVLDGEAYIGKVMLKGITYSGSGSAGL
jgi:hypothetical protein